jgi:plastocyanin
VVSLEVRPSTFSIPAAGTQQLTAVATDEKGATVSGVKVTWSASPQTIASVDATGLVTGVAAGNATITASGGGASGTASVIVFGGGGQGILVTMPGDIFAPFEVTIAVGGIVSWEFPAREHNVIFATVAGAPANIATTANRTVSRRFDAAGTFPYDCTLHPGMTGRVIVR